jgi:hypothetical protein
MSFYDLGLNSSFLIEGSSFGRVLNLSSAGFGGSTGWFGGVFSCLGGGGIYSCLGGCFVIVVGSFSDFLS